MQKRGKVSIFLILGILILLIIASIGAILHFTSLNKIEEEQQSTGSILYLRDQIQTYVETCLNTAAQEGLLFIGQHGGYYEPPKNIDYQTLLPIYYYQGKLEYPNQEVILDELRIYIINELPFCLQNFYPFTTKGVKISSDQISITSTLNPTLLNLEMSMPLTIEQNVAALSLSTFTTAIPIRLQDIQTRTSKFLQEETQTPSFCFSCLTQAFEDSNYNVASYPQDQDQLIIVIRDDEYLLKGKPFEYSFLMDYSKDAQNESIG